MLQHFGHNDHIKGSWREGQADLQIAVDYRCFVSETSPSAATKFRRLLDSLPSARSVSHQDPHPDPAACSLRQERAAQPWAKHVRSNILARPPRQCERISVGHDYLRAGRERSSEPSAAHALNGRGAVITVRIREEFNGASRELLESFAASADFSLLFFNGQIWQRHMRLCVRTNRN